MEFSLRLTGRIFLQCRLKFALLQCNPLKKKLTGKWCTPLLYFIKELLVSDLGLELYILTVMPMRYAQLSGTDFFVFVRDLVYFNIACTSRCAHVWDADISRINKKKKLAKPYTAVNGVEPTRVSWPVRHRSHLYARSYQEQI